MNDIFQFLTLPKFDIPNTEKVNVSKYSKMNPEMRKKLIEFFKPFNEELYELLNQKFDWDK